MSNDEPITPIIPFRKTATELGCENAEELSDLDVWNYILKAQGKPPITGY